MPIICRNSSGFHELYTKLEDFGEVDLVSRGIFENMEKLQFFDPTLQKSSRAVEALSHSGKLLWSLPQYMPCHMISAARQVLVDLSGAPCVLGTCPLVTRKFHAISNNKGQLSRWSLWVMSVVAQPASYEVNWPFRTEFTIVALSAPVLVGFLIFLSLKLRTFMGGLICTDCQCAESDASVAQPRDKCEQEASTQ